EEWPAGIRLTQRRTYRSERIGREHLARVRDQVIAKLVGEPIDLGQQLVDDVLARRRRSFQVLEPLFAPLDLVAELLQLGTPELEGFEPVGSDHAVLARTSPFASTSWC